jgi:hypothetical protein
MRRPELRYLEKRRTLVPAIALVLIVSVLGGGPAAAELVAGGGLMPPQVPKTVSPPPPRVFVPVARQREAPPPRPVNRAPALPAPPPSDGKVRF